MAKEGRPTKLTAELIEKTTNYITQTAFPTFEGLSLHLDVSRTSLYKWMEEDDEFSYIASKLMSKQGQDLMIKGLKGEYNASIAKLLLTKHGYSDKQEIEQNLTGNVTFLNDVPRPKE